MQSYSSGGFLAYERASDLHFFELFHYDITIFICPFPFYGSQRWLWVSGRGFSFSSSRDIVAFLFIYFKYEED